MKNLLKMALMMLTLFSLSCNNRNTEAVTKPELNKINYSYFRSEKFDETQGGFYSAEKKNTFSTVFKYYTQDTFARHHLEILNDTTANFNSVKLKYIKSELFDSYNKKIKVTKYEYDLVDENDEEANIFIVDSIGIICIYYTPWNASIFFERNKKDKVLEMELLKKENSLFLSW